MPTATGFSFSMVLTVRYHPSHVSLGESITLGNGLVDLAFVRTGSHGLCKEPSPLGVAFRQTNLKVCLVICTTVFHCYFVLFCYFGTAGWFDTSYSQCYTCIPLQAAAVVAWRAFSLAVVQNLEFCCGTRSVALHRVSLPASLLPARPYGGAGRFQLLFLLNRVQIKKGSGRKLLHQTRFEMITAD